VLVGHSLRGFLSLELALQQPHLVRSLVMIASGPGFRAPEARAKFNAVIDRMAEAMPAPVAPLGHHDDDWVMRHLDRLSCPLLIIVGERDTRFHAGADYLGRIVPGSTTVVVPGAGHHPQLDDPNAVVDAIVAHLGS
jgi:pimeloyl-ACP methyl ester carboxylesterase